MSRPSGRAGAGAALTFGEISKRTGLPRSTVYDIYRRVETKFVVAYLVRYRWQDVASKRLAAA